MSYLVVDIFTKWSKMALNAVLQLTRIGIGKEFFKVTNHLRYNENNISSKSPTTQ